MKTFIKIFILTLISVNVTYSQVGQQWAQRYTSAGDKDDIVNDMVVDVQGNVYVTGYQKGPTQSEKEALTIKYNSQGVMQWIQNYVAAANNGAQCEAIYVDAAGNVYVTGQTALTGNLATLVIKYSPSGVQLWSYIFQYYTNFTTFGHDIITDATGNVYVTGQYSNYLFLVKFSSNGALIGKTHDSSSVYNSIGKKIGLDGAGKIIIGGYFGTSQSGSGLIALKFEPNLDFDWATRWDTATTNLYNAGMAIDNNSNVILIGTRTANSSISYATVKFNSNGVVQWSNTYNYAQTIPIGVVTDNLGNVYVTGTATIVGLSSQIKTIKYDPNGNEQWIRDYSNGGSGNAHGIAIDNSANIYVTGLAGAYSDLTTIKYNTNGTLQWAKGYNSGTNTYNAGVAVGVDAIGNIYVSGNSFGGTFGVYNDILTIKYAPIPTFISGFKKNALNKPINDNQNTFDTISVDYSSVTNYYVYDVNLNIDTVIHTKDSDLEFYLIHFGIADTAIYQVGGTGQNFIATILNDSATATIASGSAPFTGSYKPGRQLSQFNGQSINGSWILKIYDRATGNTGTLKAWSLDFLISTNPIGIHNMSNEIPKEYSLNQNYPNPFNPSTNIKYQVTNNGLVSMKVYDILGKEVAVLVNENQAPGKYEVDWNASNYPSGAYFYKLVAGNGSFTETKKMILVK